MLRGGVDLGWPLCFQITQPRTFAKSVRGTQGASSAWDFNQLMSLEKKQRRWGRVLHLLREMQQQGVRQVVKGFCMDERPDQYSYSIAMSAFDRGARAIGDVDFGRWCMAVCLGIGERHGDLSDPARTGGDRPSVEWRPNGVTICALITTCARAHQWRLATSFFDNALEMCPACGGLDSCF